MSLVLVFLYSLRPELRVGLQPLVDSMDGVDVDPLFPDGHTKYIARSAVIGKGVIGRSIIWGLVNFVHASFDLADCN